MCSEADNTLESIKIHEIQQSKSFSENPRLLRSTIYPCDKNICILCQKPERKLHKATLKKPRKKLLDIAKKLSEQDLLIRLYSVPNASDKLC